MTVRVNLLPQSVSERGATMRRIAVLASVFGVVLLGLVVVSLLQIRAVRDAQDRLADEQAILSQLQSEQATLQPYSELERRAQTATGQLAQALGGQVSMAGVLQDIAFAMPAEAAITSMSISVGASAEAAADPAITSFGSVSISGEVIGGHAPGVEGVLRSFDRVAGFREVYVTSSSLDPTAPELLDGEDLAVFSLDFTLGPEILTGNFLDQETAP